MSKSYRVICVSMYEADIELLNRLHRELAAAGHIKPSKSKVIRMALAQFKVPPSPLPSRGKNHG